MDDLIRAARTRIKKKQEEMLSSADLIEQARIRNAYNGGAAKPDNYIKREKTVTPAGPYTPTIKPVQATATPIKPAPVPTATPIKPAPLPTVNRIKPVSPDSPLFNGYPFVRDYTRTAQNALNTFHEQNALTAAKKNLDAETSLYGAGLSYASGDYDTADELATQAQKKAIEDKRTTQTKQGDALLQRIQSGEKIEAAQQTPDEFNKIMTGASYTQPVLINGTWIDMPAQYAQETNEKINADREKSKDTNRQAAQIKGASNAVKHDIDVTNYLSRPDFAEKSAANAVQNPTVQEAFSVMNVDIPNPAQFVADNRNALKQLPVYVLNNTRTGLDLFNNYMMLTDDEISVYNYIFNTRGRDSADEWLGGFKDVYNMRQGKYISDNTNPAYVAYASGLMNTPEGIAQWFKDDGNISSWQAANAYARENTSGVGRVGYDLLYNVMNMAPSIAVSYATGGLVNPLAGQIAGAAVTGAGAGGNAYGQALREGYDPSQARVYGALIGASETSLQYLLGGVSALGGKATGNVAKKAIGKIDKAMLRVAVESGIDALGEGAEEYLQSILEPVIRNVVLDENNEIKPFSEDALYDGFIGFLSSILLGAPGTVRSSAEISSLGKTVNTDVMQQSLLDFGINQGVETEAFRQAEHIKKKLQEDKKVTPYEWGRLVVEASAELAKKHNVGSAEDANANQDANNNIYAAQETQAQGQTEAHTPEMQRIIREYQNSVDPVLLDFYNGQRPDLDHVNIGSLSGERARAVSDILGFDVDGYTVEFTNDSRIHTRNEHDPSVNNNKDKITPEEVARIQYVIENFDGVEPGKRDHFGRNNRDGSPSKTIVLKKRVNGTYVIVEAVPDTDSRTATVITTRIEDAKKRGGHVAHEKTYASTPETTMPDSLKNNISNDSGNVNTSSQLNAATTPLYNINGELVIAKPDYDTYLANADDSLTNPDIANPQRVRAFERIENMRRQIQRERTKLMQTVIEQTGMTREQAAEYVTLLDSITYDPEIVESAKDPAALEQAILDFDKYRKKTERDIMDIENSVSVSNDIAALTGEQLKNLYRARSKALSEYAKAQKLGLSDADLRVVRDIETGRTTIQELPNDITSRNIISYYKAKQAYKSISGKIKEYNRQIRMRNFSAATALLEESDNFSNSKVGLLLAANTPGRNIQNTANNSEAAQRIYDFLIGSNDQNNALIKRTMEHYRSIIRELNLKQKPVYEMEGIYDLINERAVRKGLGKATDRTGTGRLSEADLVQLMGEGLLSAKEIAATGADVAKIQNAVRVFRGVYNDLFNQVNLVRMQNGYEPVKYRKNYFPHFKDVERNAFVRFLETIGMIDEGALDPTLTDLPTEIAGRTETFKPGKTWFANAMERLGNKSGFNSLIGFEVYLGGALNEIYRTETIQRLRAFEAALRWKYSRDGRDAIVDLMKSDLDQGCIG